MNKWVLSIFITILMLVIYAMPTSAQSTRVRGRIVDATSGEPLPYACVTFPGTTAGAVTDLEGIYSIESRDTVSRVEASIVGYKSQTKAVRLHTFNHIDFSLEGDLVAISEIEVTPDGNPAYPIIEEAVRRRQQNNPDNYDCYKCKTYTKMQLDINNIKGEFRSQRLQRNFGFIFNYADTSALTGRPSLPVMISESVADYYHNRSPRINREIIRANRTSGINDSSPFAQFTGKMHANVNFYDNFIEFFNVRFAAPLSSNFLTYYEYKLLDITQFEGRPTYKIAFYPRRVATPVLEGEMLIDAKTYAIRHISAHMSRGVNVNWIKHLNFECENVPVDSLRWFRKRDIASAEFSLTNADSTKLNSFIGTREIAYSDVELDCLMPDSIINMDRNVLVDENIDQRTEKYWDTARPYELSEKEKNIYSMVDSIKRAPLFRDIYTVINTAIGGYYNTKYLGIGPYYKMISFNDLEGVRTQLGLRTTTAVSKRVRLTGYVAYGFDDEAFKGGGSMELSLSRRLLRKLTIEGKHDVTQLGASENALTESNILSSLFSRGNERLSMVDRATIGYEHEWWSGFSTALSARIQRIHANRFVPMIKPNAEAIGYVDDGSATLSMRYSIDEDFHRSFFNRVSMGNSRYPIFMLSASIGRASWSGDKATYYRLEGGIDYKLKIPPLGYSTIHINGGRVFGSVPYPLLKLHEGNGTYFHDPYAFSCMDFYEFASDEWVSFFYEHHFGGWLLGRIPLIKKLKWREVVSCKGTWGSLTSKNDGTFGDTAARILFPTGMSSLDEPYIEAGVGIENIFKVFRIDCVWRITHRHPVIEERKVEKFAVNLGMNIVF